MPPARPDGRLEVAANDSRRHPGDEAVPQGQIVVGVSGIATESGRILMVRRGKEPYRGSWSLPGGRVHPLEPHQQALVREFGEETGLQIRVGSPAGVAEAIERTQGRHYVILSYFVTVTGGVLQAGDDAAEVRWVDREGSLCLTVTPHLHHYLDSFGAWG